MKVLRIVAAATAALAFSSTAFAANYSTAVQKAEGGLFVPMQAPTDIRGDTQPAPLGTEICCEFDACPPQPQTYASGEQFALNTYVTEELPDDGAGNIPSPWTVLWSLGIVKPSGGGVFLFLDEPIDFGDLNAQGFVPGDILNFCVAGLLALDPAPMANGVNYGSRWITPGGSAQGLTGSFNLVP